MKKVLTGLIFLALSGYAFSQQFEDPKLTGEGFTKPKVSIGGAFAIQYQVLKHHADSTLIPLGTGINLPTANLNLDVDLAEGIKLNLVTYLSSRHHTDTWVKGGYLLIDKLPFLKSPAVNNLMNYLTIRIGDMEINYGDEHFRRSDNGNVIRNSFVGNYIMDGFTTSPSMEVMFRNKGILVMGAVTEGTLDPLLVSFKNNTYTAYDAARYFAYYWKAGFDKQFNDDLRLRFTLSGYLAPRHYSGSIYYGDRTGSRYYLVMKRETNSASDVDISSNHTTGRWGPGTTNKDNSLMFNLFAKFKSAEFFGTYETAKGNYLSGNEFKFSQIAAEGIYRFGGNVQFYGGLRYNFVKGNTDLYSAGNQSVNRIQAGAGWFILKSTVLKVEYVNQKYTDFISIYGPDAGFNGFMFEAAVSF